MSLHLQQQIKQNASEIRDYLSDLYDWEETLNKNPKKQEIINNKIDSSAPIRGKVEQEKNINPKLKRDNNSVQNYYDAWSKVDVDKLLEDDSTIVTDVFKQPTQSIANQKIVIKGGRQMVKSQVLITKDIANGLFKQLEFKEAIIKYSECIDELKNKHSLNEEELSQLVIIYSNRAQCYIKLLDYINALNDCNNALILDNNHQKTLLRRSTTLQELGKWKEALKDAQRLVILGENDAQNIVTKLEKKIQIKRETAKSKLKEVKPYMKDAIMIQVEDENNIVNSQQNQKNYLNEIDD